MTPSTTLRAQQVQMSFWLVHHSADFDAETVESWWSDMADADYAAMAAAQRKNGICAHHFLPSIRGPVLSLYESCDELHPDEFARRHAEYGTPLPITTLCLLHPASNPSAWLQPAPAAGVTTGSIFWVEHTPTCAGASEALLATARDGELESPHPEALRNHLLCAMPRSEPTGNGEVLHTVWETRAPMDAEDFQAFIDSPGSPAGESWTGEKSFANEVFSIKPVGFVRDAAFPRRASFMQKMPLPFLGDTMSMMRTMGGAMRKMEAIVAEDAAEQLPYGEWSASIRPERPERTSPADKTRAAITTALEKRSFKVNKYKSIVMRASKWPTDCN